MKRLLILAALLALGACTQNPSGGATIQPITVQSPVVIGTPAPKVQQNPLQQLATFSLADLQAADVLAKSQVPPDTTASQCYDYLIALIPTIQVPGSGTTVGAIVLFQQGRDLANGIQSSNGVLKSLNLACAPLVLSTQALVNQLAIIGAGAAATGGASILPGL